ncbi:hypothetical protein SASPL_114619 [Salvia splendens]|uniref:Uncharacterized protein n=1 Tax=Salvia splendens TaxID=180675 RepID=A0A8X8Y614_SALSN|nr:hypothetical protein SASPL_114619 [Salvia splendens]
MYCGISIRIKKSWRWNCWVMRYVDEELDTEGKEKELSKIVERRRIRSDCLVYTVVGGKNCVSYGRMLRKAKTELLEFKWKTNGTTEDCGVYAMQDIWRRIWGLKCDLTNKPSKSFQLLHSKFIIAMVYSNKKKVEDYMMRTATSHLEEA